jgi:hypothetical protein
LGALAVYTKVIGGDGAPMLTPVWKLYNHQGPDWRYAQALVQQEKPFSVNIHFFIQNLEEKHETA